MVATARCLAVVLVMLGGCATLRDPECVDDAGCVDGCRAGRCEAGVCVAWAQRAHAAPCDDGDPCTEGDGCLAGTCTGAPRDCDDGEPCTTDGCTAGTGCRSEPGPCLLVTVDGSASGAVGLALDGGGALSLAPGAGGALALVPNREPWVLRVAPDGHPEGQHCAPEPMRGVAGGAQAVTVRCGDHGTLDHGWGDRGVYLDEALLGAPADILALEDGRVVLAGYVQAGPTRDLAVTRLTAAGGRDTAFADDGRLVLATDVEEEAHVAVVQSTGRVVVAGARYPDLGGEPYALLLRLDDDGELDPTFACYGALPCTKGEVPGIVQYRTTTWEGVRDLLVLPDDRLLWVGTGRADDAHHQGGLVSLLDPDGGRAGSADTLCPWTKQGTIQGPGSCVLVPCQTHVGPHASCEAMAHSLVRLPDGRLLVGGVARDPVTWAEQGQAYLWTLARLEADGAWDESFGLSFVPDRASHGGLALGSSGELQVTVRHLEVAADGRIVGVLRLVDDATGAYCATAAWLEDGTPDPSFGAAGVVQGACAPGHHGLAVDDAGRILLAVGRPDSAFSLRRLTHAGAPDPTWGPDGVLDVAALAATGGHGALPTARATTLELLPDGRLLLAGHAETGGQAPARGFLAARIWP